MALLAEQIAQFGCALRFEDIPPAVIEQMSWHCLDTVGVCLAATPLVYARAIEHLVLSDGGKPESTLFAGKTRVPARSAAFYNACMGHGVDFDDTHLDALLHPTSTILPPVLALAQARSMDGTRLLTALTLGAEVMIRVGLAVSPGLLRRGLHPTSVCGAFGAAAAMAKLMDLTAAQTVDALGIVGGMCGGLHQSSIDGSWNKCMHSGIAAQAGFMAAELAQEGFTGSPSIFEGRKGLFRAFAGEGNFDEGQVTDELGERWEAGRLAYKVYPCCQGIHAYADCALELANVHHIDPDQIERIEARIGKAYGASLCEPREVKTAPPTSYGAKFSMPFIVATALLDRTVTNDSFSDDSIRNQRVLALAQRFDYVADPYYDEGTALRGRLKVSLKDGRELVSATEACLGTPENPWPRETIVAKFMGNASPIIGARQANELAGLIPGLAELKDVGAFAERMGAPAAA